MFGQIFSLVVSIVIAICAYATIYVENTDFEYTNSLADIVAEVEENGVPAEVVKEIEAIKDTASPSEIIEQINEAELSGEIESTSIEFSNMNIVESYEYMRTLNTDTIGWLNIPNIGSYPVMYIAGDNSYYLTHSSTKQEFENGAIFMNGYCNGSFDDMALIHGHHLKSGGMFGSLKKYKDSWFFNTNELIEVYDGAELKYYRPFSVFYYEDGVEYIQLSFESQQAKTDYVNELLDRSIVGFTEEYTINTANDIMILSTCDYEFDNCRLAIACYEVLSIPYTE